MKIDDWYPQPPEILNCEKKTLQFLKDFPMVKRNFPTLAQDAKLHFFAIDLNSNRGLKFESHFDIKVDKRDGIAHIGAEIIGQNKDCFEKTCYYIVISRKDDNEVKPRILRKFHFDYEQPKPSQRQPHPVFHLQYGGKLSSELKEMNLEGDHLDTWLSEPRIGFYPTSLALLINLALKEFPDEKNFKLMQKSEWKDLIKKNENFFLKPFFERCHNFFSNRKGNHLFTNDFCYGE